LFGLGDSFTVRLSYFYYRVVLRIKRQLVLSYLTNSCMEMFTFVIRSRLR